MTQAVKITINELKRHNVTGNMTVSSSSSSSRSSIILGPFLGFFRAFIGHGASLYKPYTAKIGVQVKYQ